MGPFDAEPSSPLKNFSIRWPLLVSFGTSMVIFLAVLLASLWWLAGRIQSDLQEKDAQEVGAYIIRLLDQEKWHLQADLAVIARMKPLSEAFLAGDRERLLQESQPFLAVMKERQITRWVYYLPDLTHFLRVHHPAEHGDRTGSALVQTARQTGQFTFGVEVGHAGVPTLRGVMPWQVNGETIGYLELHQETMHLIDTLRGFAGASLYAFFHKEALDREEFLVGGARQNLQVQWDAHPELVGVIPAGGQIPQAVWDYLRGDRWRAEGSHAESFDPRHLLFNVPVRDTNHRPFLRIVAQWEHTLPQLFQVQITLFVRLALAMILVLGWVYYRRLGKVERRIQESASDHLEMAKQLVKAQRIAQVGNWEFGPDRIPPLRGSAEMQRIVGGDGSTPVATWDDLLARVHPEDQAGVREALAALQGGHHHPLDLEFRMMGREEDPRHVQLRAEGVGEGSAAGSPVSFGTLQEVTGLKRMEQLALKNAVFLRNVLESTDDGILLTVGQNVVTYCNARFLSMWNLAGESADREQQIMEEIPPQLQDPELFWNPMVRQCDSPETSVDLLCLQDGRYLERHGYPILGEAGMLGRMWRFADHTTHHQARRREERVAQSNQAINALLETAMEPLELPRQLQAALEVILAVPWLGVQNQGSIYLVDEHGSGDLFRIAEVGLLPQLLIDCQRIPLGHCLCGRAASERKIVFASHIDERHEVRVAGAMPHGHYCVPIISRKTLLGVINLYVDDGHARQVEEDAFLTTVANLLAGLIMTRRVVAPLGRR